MTDANLDEENPAEESKLDARPKVLPYDPAKAREWVRGAIALGLTAVFILLMLFLIAMVATGYLETDRLEKIAAVLLSPLVGLLGAVLGFYYGEHARGR